VRGRRAALTSLLLALAGCSSGGEIDSPQDLSRDEPADPHGDLACDEATRADLDATIDAQLEAFADDDYDAALALTTEGFQEQFNAERLRGIIEDGFPLVTEADGHTSETCVESEGVAQLLVSVTAGDEELELVYSLESEEGEWRIAGAKPTGEGPAGDDPGLV